jgi:hypothetical protein
VTKREKQGTTSNTVKPHDVLRRTKHYLNDDDETWIEVTPVQADAALEVEVA